MADKRHGNPPLEVTETLVVKDKVGRPRNPSPRLSLWRVSPLIVTVLPFSALTLLVGQLSSL